MFDYLTAIFRHQAGDAEPAGDFLALAMIAFILGVILVIIVGLALIVLLSRDDEPCADEEAYPDEKQ